MERVFRRPARTRYHVPGADCELEDIGMVFFGERSDGRAAYDVPTSAFIKPMERKPPGL